MSLSHKLVIDTRRYLRSIDYTEWAINCYRAMFRWFGIPVVIYMLIFGFNMIAINVLLVIGLTRLLFELTNIPKKEETIHA